VVDGEFFGRFQHHAVSAPGRRTRLTPRCLIYAMAVPWRDHPDLAKHARRWVNEAFSQVDPKTPAHAVRQP